jgi:hypothetical protein
MGGTARTTNSLNEYAGRVQTGEVEAGLADVTPYTRAPVRFLLAPNHCRAGGKMGRTSHEGDAPPRIRRLRRICSDLSDRRAAGVPVIAAVRRGCAIRRHGPTIVPERPKALARELRRFGYLRLHVLRPPVGIW